MSAHILVLGCSYGLLPAMRLAFAGCRVTMVGRADEVATMASQDLTVHLPDRHGGAGHVLRARSGQDIALTTPDQADPAAADMVLLAMQEPQYTASEVAALMGQIATSGRPCLSIMNLPPPPFLARLGIGQEGLEGVYASATVWEQFDPDQVSLASPDPQALRLDPAQPGALTVTLPSNFKAAPFVCAADQTLLEGLARDWAAFKQHGQRPPVQLLAHQSLHVPLAKWPMLIAGNCRCLTGAEPRAIAAAVHDDLAASAALYDLVSALALSLGARQADLVPFAAYAKAALGLTRPSSLARALAGGARQVERIDLLVQRLLARQGLDAAPLDPIVDAIEARLAANRAA